jgi:two-component system alkaline phosphatase synthesis response regulator PhoP
LLRKSKKRQERMLGLFKSKKKTDQVKILIIDDETDLVSTIEYRLKCYNYSVITAVNGKEGLEKAIAEKPDLILLDTDMPVMNGHQMLEQVRNHPEIKDVPVIMVTALCEAKDITTASSYGISDYVTKPFDFTELMEKITSAMENPKRR